MPGVACDTEWECHEKGRCPGLEEQSGEGTELASYMAFGQSVCEWVEAGHVKVKSMYVCWGGDGGIIPGRGKAMNQFFHSRTAWCVHVTNRKQLCILLI